MGSFQSNYVNSQIKILNETIVKVENKVRMDSRQDCSDVQKLFVKFGDKAQIIGKVSLEQRKQLACNFNSTGTGDLSTSILSAIDNKIQEAIAQSNQATQEFLATAVATGTNKTILETFLHNSFEAAIQNSFEGTCRQNLYALQELEVIFDGRITGDLDIKQNSQASAMASCIMQFVAESLSDNEQVNDIIKEVDQRNISEQKGLGSLFNSLIIIGVLFGILFLIFVFSKTIGKKKIKKLL